MLEETKKQPEWEKLKIFQKCSCKILISMKKHICKSEVIITLIFQMFGAFSWFHILGQVLFLFWAALRWAGPWDCPEPVHGATPNITTVLF